MTMSPEMLKAGADAQCRGDYKTALKLWQPLAEQGDPDAQLFMGYVYLLGKEVKQDYAEAYFWYSLVAAQKWNPLTSVFANYPWPAPLTHDPKTGKEIIAQAPPANEEEAVAAMAASAAGVSRHLTPGQKAAVDKRVADWIKDHPAP